MYYVLIGVKPVSQSLLVEATNALKVTKKNQTENVTNGCEILFSGCLAKCDRVSLKHHRRHKGVDRAAYIDLIRCKGCLIVCVIPVDQHLLDWTP